MKKKNSVAFQEQGIFHFLLHSVIRNVAFINKRGAPVRICSVRMVLKVIAKCVAVASPCDAYGFVCTCVERQNLIERFGAETSRYCCSSFDCLWTLASIDKDDQGLQRP